MINTVLTVFTDTNSADICNHLKKPTYFVKIAASFITSTKDLTVTSESPLFDPIPSKISCALLGVMTVDHNRTWDIIFRRSGLM